MNTAYFVKRPRVVGELLTPHRPEEELPYVIAGEVVLSAMDYENFTTDLRADRAFLESVPAANGADDVPRCLLVRRRGRADGVLVIPERGAFVGWAAYRFS